MMVDVYFVLGGVLAVGGENADDKSELNRLHRMGISSARRHHGCASTPTKIIAFRTTTMCRWATCPNRNW
jgi:hypothetical protein